MATPKGFPFFSWENAASQNQGGIGCDPVLIVRKVVRCHCQVMRCLRHKSLRKTMVPSDIDLQITNGIRILPKTGCKF